MNRHKPEAKPRIEIQGLQIEYDAQGELWEFIHMDTNFHAFGRRFVVPSEAQLKSILDDIEALHPEMARKLSKGWRSWRVEPNDGENCVVNLTDLQPQNAFKILWFGGESWGDMRVNFTIKDHAITGEYWSC